MKKKTSILLLFIKTIVICFMTIKSKATESILLSLLETKTKQAPKKNSFSRNINNETITSSNSTSINDKKESKEENLNKNQIQKDQILLQSKETKSSISSEIETQNENFVKISKATTTIFLSGLFDKSFFITAFMAMKYSKWIVLFSTSLSLSLIGIISVYLGVTINKYVSVIWIDSIAVALFLIFGVHMIYEGFYMKEDEQTEVQILRRKSASADADPDAKLPNEDNDEEKGLIKASFGDNHKRNFDNFIDKDIDNQYYFNYSKKICECDAENRKNFNNRSFRPTQEKFLNKKNSSSIKQNRKVDNNEVVPITANSFNFISHKAAAKGSNNNCKNAVLDSDSACSTNKNITNNSDANDLLLQNTNANSHSEKFVDDKIDNLIASEDSTVVDSFFCCEKSKELYKNSPASPQRTNLNCKKKCENENEDEEQIYKKTQKANLTEIHVANFLCNNSINVFSKVFFLIFFSEIGDRSQISTIYLTTNFDKFSVIVAVIVSSTVLTILAVFGGKLLANKISEKKLTIFAGWVFIVFGLIALYLLFVNENVNEGLSSDSAAVTDLGTPSVILNEIISQNNITNKIKQKIH